jgi:ubiquinone/menaquinone biosynthesis C-methylase UbiE
MEQALFKSEDDKYSFLWANGYRPARWKLLADALLKSGRGVPGKPTLVDFGSGQGNAVEYFSRKGMKATGIDISRYAAERLRERGYPCFWSSLDSLAGIPDDSFDFGFSNDVLEHIPEPYIDASLAEMRRVCARSLFLSICPTPSRNKSKEGENLHLTVRPKAWWEEKLKGIGAVREIRFFLNRSIRYEISLGKRDPGR